MGHVVDWLVNLPPAWVLVAAFVVPLLESSVFAGFVFPGEIAVLIAGAIASQGSLPVWSVIVVASAGAIIGDSVGYEVGRQYGEGLLKRLPKRLVKLEHIERTKGMLRRRGGQALVVGRFTAALRVLVPGMAGISRMPYRSFLLFNALGGIAWAAETAVVGYIAGHSFRSAEDRLSIIGFGVLALLIGGYVVHKLRRHPRVAPLIDARVTTRSWTGRPLTLAVAAAGLAGWLFGGLLQDVLAHDGAALQDPAGTATWCSTASFCTAVSRYSAERGPCGRSAHRNGQDPLATTTYVGRLRWDAGDGQGGKPGAPVTG